jgi:hypothetical protein
VLVDVGDSAGNFTFTDVTANDNGTINYNGQGAGTTCTGSDSCLGVLIDGGSFGPGNATLTNITTNHNAAGTDCTGPNECFGLSVDGVIGNVLLSQVTASNNKAGGNCSGSQSCFGVLAEADGRGNVQLQSVTASNNGATGTCSGGGDASCYGVSADTTTEIPEGPPGPGNVDLNSVTANQNTRDGFDILAVGDITITCSTATGNGAVNVMTNKPPVKNSCP